MMHSLTLGCLWIRSTGLMAQNGGFLLRRLTSTGREYGAIHSICHKTVSSSNLSSALFPSALTSRELQLQQVSNPQPSDS